MDDRSKRKDEFIDALAEYLTRDLALRSIQLGASNVSAIEWARLFQLAGLFGYPSKEEAVRILKELL